MDCVDNNIYTHCQQYYLFQLNTTSKRCQRFERQPCRSSWFHSYSDMPSNMYSDTTLTTQFSFVCRVALTPSLTRLDRMPYLLKRWQGPISIAIFITESEVRKLATRIAPFLSSRRIVFSFYVHAGQHPVLSRGQVVGASVLEGHVPTQPSPRPLHRSHHHHALPPY